MDEAIERLAQGYAGRDFRQRRRVTIEPVCEYGHAEWTLDDFLALLAEVKTEMPADAKDAKVVFEGGSYDESGKFVVSYTGWEDESAVADRVERALAYGNAAVCAEREEYERLKAKFDP